MKGFIELTSLRGSTWMFRVDQIYHVNKKASFEEKDFEIFPELKDTESCVILQLLCDCTSYYLRDSYEDVVKKMGDALNNV